MTTSAIRAADAYLMSLPRFAERGKDAYQPGLDRIWHLLESIGHPERAYSILHVGGTNGKGSVASIAASVMTSAGLRVGLHTSPHLQSVCERMRIDGIAATEAWLTDAVDRIRAPTTEVGASFFEVTVALSLLFFAENSVDAAVVEVGLGGRFDATNVLIPEVTVITNVGLEHTDILGDTIELIAREKAGIIKEERPVITAAHEPAYGVIRATAEERGALVENIRASCEVLELDPRLAGSHIAVATPQTTYRNMILPLPGSHQVWNAVLAIRSSEIFFERRYDHLGEDIVAAGVSAVRNLAGLRGRFEVLCQNPLIVADVAHNPEGIRAILEHLETIGPAGTRFVAIGYMRDKDIIGLAAALRAAHARVFCVGVDSPRSWTANELAFELKRLDVAVDKFGSISDALKWFRDCSSGGDNLLIAGSHLVVAAAMSIDNLMPEASRNPGRKQA